MTSENTNENYRKSGQQHYQTNKKLSSSWKLNRDGNRRESEGVNIVASSNRVVLNSSEHIKIGEHTRKSIEMYIK